MARSGQDDHSHVGPVEHLGDVRGDDGHAAQALGAIFVLDFYLAAQGDLVDALGGTVV